MMMVIVMSEFADIKTLESLRSARCRIYKARKEAYARMSGCVEDFVDCLSLVKILKGLIGGLFSINDIYRIFNKRG